jgi:hypothetical protein
MQIIEGFAWKSIFKFCLRQKKPSKIISKIQFSQYKISKNYVKL